MNTFFEEVDTTNRQAMIDFLRGHYRYHTMNSWNNSKSYANCVKVHKLGLTREQENKAFDMLEMPDVYDTIHMLISDWTLEHNRDWTVGFNGRSSGYLVLYQCTVSNGKLACYPGRSTDQGEDFSDESEWDNESLKDRVELVQSFDRLCDDIVSEFVYFCDNFTIEEEEIQVTKKVKVLQEKVATL